MSVCMCVCIYINDRKIDIQIIYGKELAHVITKTKKSQDLQATSWMHRRENVQLQFQSKGLKTKKTNKFQSKSQQPQEPRKANVYV